MIVPSEGSHLAAGTKPDHGKRGITPSRAVGTPFLEEVEAGDRPYAQIDLAHDQRPWNWPPVAAVARVSAVVTHDEVVIRRDHVGLREVVRLSGGPGKGLSLDRCGKP